MRVLFAIGSMGGGGAERQALHYLRHLDRSRFQPSLYLHTREGELLDGIPEDVPVFAFWDRHSEPRFNLPGRIRGQQIRDLADVLEELQIDVLCAVTIQLALIAGRSVQRRPTPWLAVEMADPRLSFVDLAGRFRWLKRRLLRAGYGQAHRAIAVSEGVREGMIQWYRLPPNQVATLPNFIDVDQLDRLSAAPGPELDRQRFQLVSVGRLHPQKGHCFLLEALSDLVNQRGLQQLQLQLLGQGVLEKELREFVDRNKLQEHVKFNGFVDNPFAFMRQCQLFCFPSLYEGLPLALLEAMGCGVPVLAANCRSGPSEVLAGGRFGRLVPPADARALADAIEDTVQHYPRHLQVAAAARQRVEQHYSVTLGIRQLEDLLVQARRSR